MRLRLVEASNPDLYAPLTDLEAETDDARMASNAHVVEADKLIAMSQDERAFLSPEWDQDARATRRS